MTRSALTILDGGAAAHRPTVPVFSRTVPPLRPSHAHLVMAQTETLSAPPRRYGFVLRSMVRAMDLLYGRRRTMSKFRVLEVVARMPYQSWERSGYSAVTRLHRRAGVARQLHDGIVEARRQQDNEQWHLLITEELVRRSGVREGWLRYTLMPRLMAASYAVVSRLLGAIRAEWGYRLNADLEDHAEREYMQYVAEHPELEDQPFDSAYEADYGHFESVADALRQIGCDERVHKEESLARLAQRRAKRASEERIAA